MQCFKNELKNVTVIYSFSVSNIFFSVSIYIFISFLKSSVHYYWHKSNYIIYHAASEPARTHCCHVVLDTFISAE